jgi:hypothetical protein
MVLSVISAAGRLRQDGKYKACPGYIVRILSQTTKQNKTKQNKKKTPN